MRKELTLAIVLIAIVAAMTVVATRQVQAKNTQNVSRLDTMTDKIIRLTPQDSNTVEETTTTPIPTTGA
jgi:hypothetical protein